MDEIKIWLQETYRIPVLPRLAPYLIDHAALVQQLGENHPMAEAEEVVLFRQTRRDYQLGLYLNPKLLRAKAHESRAERTHRYLTVTEGLSHLLLLYFKIQIEAPVSRLEMELQAEIDKFLFARLPRSTSPDLIPRYHLQHAINLPRLDADGKACYETAQRLANRYCLRLEREYLSHGSHDNLLHELREFYRKSHWEKLKYLGNP